MFTSACAHSIKAGPGNCPKTSLATPDWLAASKGTAPTYSNVCCICQVIVDPATGRSKGYGFVRFASENERDRSLEMQGFQLSNRPVRVSLATARRSSSAGMPGIHPAELDPTNTTLFIGGLSAGVSEDQLRAIFQNFGDVVYTKIPQGKGCGFVQFVNRPDAERAMTDMNGQIVGSSAIRISWGRSTSRIGGMLAAAAAPRQPGMLGAYGSAGYGSALDAYGAPGMAPAGGTAGGLYGAAAAAAAPAGAYDVSNMYGGYGAGSYPMSSQVSSADSNSSNGQLRQWCACVLQL